MSCSFSETDSHWREKKGKVEVKKRELLLQHLTEHLFSYCRTLNSKHRHNVDWRILGLRNIEMFGRDPGICIHSYP